MTLKYNAQDYTIRIATPQEFTTVGKLMVKVYSQLDGFPTAAQQPAYYHMLANVGELTQTPKTEILIAVAHDGQIHGVVVYFGDMKYYGSGGTATKEKNAGGFRLLAVDPRARGQGLGKQLTKACIDLGKKSSLTQIIIHTTNAMQLAWKMYEKLGFRRSEDLDFMQGELPVFGFRLKLNSLPA